MHYTGGIAMANKWMKKLGLGVAMIMTVSQMSGVMVFAAPEEYTSEDETDFVDSLIEKYENESNDGFSEIDNYSDEEFYEEDELADIDSINEDVLYATAEIYGDYEYTCTKEKITIVKYNGQSSTPVIPNTIDNRPVTKLGASAFRGNNSITSIVIPETIELVGSSCFSNCENLERVIFIEIEDENREVSLSDYCFSGCTNLTDIQLSHNIGIMGNYLFKDDTSLTNITLPDSLRNIGCGAFWGTGIKRITLPQLAVTGYGKVSPFLGADNLEEVILADGMKYVPAHLFDFESGKSNISKISFPDTIEKIDEYAFYCFKDLTDISLPQNLVSIERYAFSGCDGLTGITIPSNVEKIGDYCFQKCNNLKSVVFEQSLNDNIKVVINDSAFSYCPILSNVELSNKTYKIDAWAFRNDLSLESIFLPDSLRVLGSYAFEGTSIKSVTIPNRILTTYGGDGWNLSVSPFAKANKLEEIILEDGIRVIPEHLFDFTNEICLITTVNIPDSVVNIDDYAFMNCKSLSSISLPQSIQSIGYMSFAGCDGLNEIRFPSSVTSIGTYCFENCKDLETVIFEPSIYDKGSVTINDGAFRNCPKLSNVELSNNTGKIDAHAFIHDTSLKEIVLPESLLRIGSNVFDDTSISKIVIPKNLHTAFGADGWGLIESPFANAKDLIQVAFEEGMISIPERVLYFNKENTSLRIVIIPSSVSSIPDNAFYNCKNITIYGYTNSYAETYAKEHDIPFMALEEEINENQSGFDLKVNGYCIENSKPAFSYDSAANWFNLFGYKFPLERYQEVYGNSYTQHIYDQNVSEWPGNCFGMSVTAVLFYKNKLPIQDYLKEDNTVLTAEYDDMITKDNQSYLYLNMDSELTKLIERYQIWWDSDEFSRLYAKNRINYINGTNKEVFSSMITRIQQTKEPFIVLVQWKEDNGKTYAHAMVVDSSRPPEKIIDENSDGWIRVYLYDPNNPYYGNFSNNTPKDCYLQSLNRYVELNTQNGYWRMDAMVNGDATDTTPIGYDAQGNILKESIIQFIDAIDYPINFDTKAHFSLNISGSIGVAYRSNDFSIYDKDNTLVYQKQDGTTKYANDKAMDYVYCGYVPGLDRKYEEGTIILPEEQYTVKLENGFIAYKADGDYIGIISQDNPVSITTIDSNSVSVSSENAANVNVVIMDQNTEDDFASIETNIQVDNNECTVSLDNNILDVDVPSNQKIEINIITDEIENGKTVEVSTNNVENYNIITETTTITETIPSGSTPVIIVNADGTTKVYQNGKELENYTGLALLGTAENAPYVYVENGTRNETFCGFVDYDGETFYVAGGTLATDLNGLQVAPNGIDWYFLANGQVQKHHEGLALYDGEWFYIKDGKLNTALNAYVDYDGGKFFVGAGRIIQEYSGLAQDPENTESGDWYFLANGQAQIQYTGLAYYDNAWFYVEAGKLAKGFYGTVEYDGTSFEVYDGMVL